MWILDRSNLNQIVIEDPLGQFPPVCSSCGQTGESDVIVAFSHKDCGLENDPSPQASEGCIMI